MHRLPLLRTAALVAVLALSAGLGDSFGIEENGKDTANKDQLNQERNDLLRVLEEIFDCVHAGKFRTP